MKKSFKSFTNLDSVTVECPCGASITGEGDCISKFMKQHKKHTDGMCDDTITDDGMRVFTAGSQKTQRVKV